MIANLLALTLLAAQTLQINVNAKDGDVITGEKIFRVTVSSSRPINQVEFYVNGELRDTDRSTPYEFKIDSLAEPEGAMKVQFKAYDNQGKSASKLLNVKIDNLLGLTPEQHVAKAQESLTVSKWDAALLSARIALKAKPGLVSAQLAMARAYFGKGVLDSAQKFAEDAAEKEPGNMEAADLLAAINLQKAFQTYNRGGERKETLTVIRGAMISAIEHRRRSLDASFEAVGAPTEANLLQYADAAIKASRFQQAINALAPEFRKDNRRTDIGNRLAFSQIRAGKIADAAETLNLLKKYGAPDAYSLALIAIVTDYMGNLTASDEAMRDAIIDEGDNLGVRTAQAYLALKRGNRGSFGNLTTQLAKDEGQRTEALYYLTAMYHSMNNYEASRKSFERGVLTEPTNYAMYIERATESVGMFQSGRLSKSDADLELESARVHMEAALAARPESHEALTGMALVLLFQGKKDEAYKYASAATMTAPTYAPGFYALAAVYASQGNTTEATRANNTAGKLDKANLEGRELPKPAAAWAYFARNGQVVVMVAPK
jgi:thioredoxin-like negative regulator of GroEL